MRLAILFGLLLMAWDASPAKALTFCSRPRTPYCVDSFSTFDDEFAFQSCRTEVESFVRDTKRYAECLDEERADAARDANKAVKQFNCKARRETFCP